MSSNCDVYPAPLHSVVILSSLHGRGAGDRVCGIMHTRATPCWVVCACTYTPRRGEEVDGSVAKCGWDSSRKCPTESECVTCWPPIKAPQAGVLATWEGEGTCEPGKEPYGKSTFETKGPVAAKESKRGGAPLPAQKTTLAFRESSHGKCNAE